MKASATDNPAVRETSYSFGLYVLDSGDGTLTRDSVRVRVQEQPFQLLLLLVERAGQIVSRDEIRNRLWPQNTFVEFDKSLGVAVLKVREALGDDASNPRFIETIPRRGYRFIAPVKVESAQVAGPLPPIAGAPTLSASKPNLYGAKHWLIIASLVLLLVGTVFYVVRPRHGSPLPTAQAGNPIPRVHVRRSVAVLGFRNLPNRPEDDWLSSAFCEMLNTELAAGGELRMVPGEDVARVQNELPLSGEDSLGKSTL